MKDDSKISTTPQNKKNYKTKLLILLITFTFIFTVAFIVAIFIYPKICISNINDKYNSQQYYEVSQYNSKLDMLKKYLKNNDGQYNDVQYKVKLSQAYILIENTQFETALNELLEIQSPDEIVNNKINDCKYELGKKCLETEEYDRALEFFQEVISKDDINDLLDETYSKLALKYLTGKQFTLAIDEIAKVNNKDSENYKNIKKKIHYEYGKYSLSINDYNGGIANLEQAKDYEYANTLINNAYIEQAEKYIKAGNLQEAKKIYDYLPEEVEHDGIKVSSRKSQLNNFASLISVTGKKYATKSYCETKNVWKYDGRWDSWYIDTPDSYEYIETTLVLNEDGTATLKGNVYFKAFDDFSSLSEYCQAKIFSRAIEIKNINKMPSTYKIDENTTLSYSNGTFSLKYNKKDNYSINFYNVYSSKVTY